MQPQNETPLLQVDDLRVSFSCGLSDLRCAHLQFGGFFIIKPPGIFQDCLVTMLPHISKDRLHGAEHRTAC